MDDDELARRLAEHDQARESFREIAQTVADYRLNLAQEGMRDEEAAELTLQMQAWLLSRIGGDA